MNHMAEVAKMFGVELGESFKITSDTQGDYQNYYRFTENNCLEMSDDGVEWGMTVTLTLRGILMGDIRIVKLPWKPKMDEKYYIPSIFDCDFYKYNFWLNDEHDEKFYKRGLVFKTKEEAIEMSKKMLAIAKERGNLA